MKSKNITNGNYLKRKPVRRSDIVWSADDSGLVTFETENKGVFNRLFQIILKKPRKSYIHLDETGSFVWLAADGESDIAELGKKVEERFAENAMPLYERLVRYLEVLEGCRFIEWK